MAFLPALSVSVMNLWIFSAIFIIINFGTLVLFPKYNIRKFVTTSKIKYVTPLNNILYYGFFIFSIFIPISSKIIFVYIGSGIYIFGLLMYIASVFSFAVSEYNKPVTNRMYMLSRHPVYVSFLILMIGISLASGTYIVMIITILHFISTLYILNKEEEECKRKYGKEYIDYTKKVKKIISFKIWI